MAEITIGIPFYNCERYLTNAIRSVYAQSYTDWEAIFVDDGSTDASLDIVRSVRDARIRVLSDGVNLGIGARRKQIVDLTETRYLAWLDADDMMHPDRLQVQYEFLERHPEIACVDSSCYIVDPNAKVVRLSEKMEGIVAPSSMAVRPQMQNASVFARIEVYRDFNFNPACRRVEDWDVWIRASKQYSFYHLNAFLGYHLDADEHHKPRLDRELVEPRWQLMVYLRHGGRSLGIARCAALSARLCARTAYRVILILLGQHKRFKAARTDALTPELKAAAERELERMLETKVPGIDC